MSSPRNFTDYFREEADIYVQNLADAQVSCEFPIAQGRTEGFTFPYNRDPINLTQHIPFHAIKGSMDFRKMLSRRPPALQLLSQEEYESWFAKKAKRKGFKTVDGEPDVDAAIEDAENIRQKNKDYTANTSPKPIHAVVETGTGPQGARHFGERDRVVSSEFVTEDEMINPRVLHLCNQVKSELEDEERMPSSELLEALESIPNLKLEGAVYKRLDF